MEKAKPLSLLEAIKLYQINGLTGLKAMNISHQGFKAVGLSFDPETERYKVVFAPNHKKSFFVTLGEIETNFQES